jgi:aldose 1-epimerase
LILRSGATSVTVDPVAGGRVAAVAAHGHELLVGPMDDPLAWGCYPMAPWVGRTRDGRFTFEGREYELSRNLRPDAIHGTVFDRAWNVAARESEWCELTITLGSGWPFAGTVTQRIAASSNGLRLELRIDAEERMPACLGWHPWFARGDGVDVEFDRLVGSLPSGPARRRAGTIASPACANRCGLCGPVCSRSRWPRR